MLESLFDKVKERAAASIESVEAAVKTAAPKNLVKPEIPNDLMWQCPRCRKGVFIEKLEANKKVCPECSYHSRITAAERIAQIADKESFEEINANLSSKNPLGFPGYTEKVSGLTAKTHLNDGVVTGRCSIRGISVILGVMDSRFMMASMGTVAGEKITRAFEEATKEKLPIIFFTASGGARMQEGILSLMQMAKTSAAVKRHSDAGLLYMTVLTDPTTGGVTASFASLGDIIIAEPKVLVGFAGRTVIEDTIKQRLPEDFQSAEFMLAHGFVDMIIPRVQIRRTLAHLLLLHRKPKVSEQFNFVDDYAPAAQNPLPAYDRLLLIRHKDRPTIKDYLPLVFDDVFELAGDRLFADDKAIFGGIAYFKGVPVTVISHVKGRNFNENKESNFGMPHPEGYRKALRLAKQAEKFGRPVIFFIDTSGAYCGIGAEERGQGEAIARNLYELISLKTPMVSIVMGEGGSGGALAIGVCDNLAMLENSLYSVISPRGAASILWKDGGKEKQAANILKITAEDLVSFGIADKIISEPLGGAHNSLGAVSGNISEYLKETLKNILQKDIAILTEMRYNKFRNYGTEYINQ